MNPRHLGSPCSGPVCSLKGRYSHVGIKSTVFNSTLLTKLVLCEDPTMSSDSESKPIVRRRRTRRPVGAAAASSEQKVTDPVVDQEDPMDIDDSSVGKTQDIAPPGSVH